jgi:hypothetical protein
MWASRRHRRRAFSSLLERHQNTLIFDREKGLFRTADRPFLILI